MLGKVCLADFSNFHSFLRSFPLNPPKEFEFENLAAHLPWWWKKLFRWLTRRDEAKRKVLAFYVCFNHLVIYGCAVSRLYLDFVSVSVAAGWIYICVGAHTCYGWCFFLLSFLDFCSLNFAFLVVLRVFCSFRWLGVEFLFSIFVFELQWLLSQGVAQIKKLYCRCRGIRVNRIIGTRARTHRYKDTRSTHTDTAAHRPGDTHIAPWRSESWPIGVFFRKDDPRVASTLPRLALASSSRSSVVFFGAVYCCFITSFRSSGSTKLCALICEVQCGVSLGISPLDSRMREKTKNAWISGFSSNEILMSIYEYVSVSVIQRVYLKPSSGGATWKQLAEFLKFISNWFKIVFNCNKASNLRSPLNFVSIYCISDKSLCIIWIFNAPFWLRCLHGLHFV